MRMQKQRKMKQLTLPCEGQRLFENLCSVPALQQGFAEVKRNKGAPGIDGISIKSFESNLLEELSQLKTELESWSYKPQPARRVEIPKPNGGVRLLGIPCVRDRVVHATIKQLLEPIFDPKFSPRSYGFRPGRNQRQAVESCRKLVESGKPFVVDIDLSKFFDRINHDRLIHRLGIEVKDKRILRLIGTILRSGVNVDGKVRPTREGAPQGSPLSPLLSNVVLDELDKELESRQLSFCRFADDCNIFVKSRKAAERVMASVSKFIESKLKLVVNQEKSRVGMSHEVKFLGMTIVNATIAISRKAMNHAMTIVKELTPRGTHKTLEQTVREINRWYVGWSNYFSMTYYPAQLQKIEAHIRRRLRSRIISQQKRRRHLYRTLVKRGAKRRSAAKAAYSNNKRWAMSNSGAMHKAYPNKWFTNKLGLHVMSDKRQIHWLESSAWVNLP